MVLSDVACVCCSPVSNIHYDHALTCIQIAAAGGALKGSALWLLLAPGQTAPASSGGGSGLYGIHANDSTFAFVTNNAGVRHKTSCTALRLTSQKQTKQQALTPDLLLLP